VIKFDTLQKHLEICNNWFFNVSHWTGSIAQLMFWNPSFGALLYSDYIQCYAALALSQGQQSFPTSLDKESISLDGFFVRNREIVSGVRYQKLRTT